MFFLFSACCPGILWRQAWAGGPGLAGPLGFSISYRPLGTQANSCAHGCWGLRPSLPSFPSEEAESEQKQPAEEGTVLETRRAQVLQTSHGRARAFQRGSHLLQVPCREPQEEVCKGERKPRWLVAAQRIEPSQTGLWVGHKGDQPRSHGRQPRQAARVEVTGGQNAQAGNEMQLVKDIKGNGKHSSNMLGGQEEEGGRLAFY